MDSFRFVWIRFCSFLDSFLLRFYLPFLPIWLGCKVVPVQTVDGLVGL